MMLPRLQPTRAHTTRLTPQPDRFGSILLIAQLPKMGTSAPEHGFASKCLSLLIAHKASREARPISENWATRPTHPPRRRSNVTPPPPEPPLHVSGAGCLLVSPCCPAEPRCIFTVLHEACPHQLNEHCVSSWARSLKGLESEAEEGRRARGVLVSTCRERM